MTWMSNKCCVRTAIHPKQSCQYVYHFKDQGKPQLYTAYSACTHWLHGLQVPAYGAYQLYTNIIGPWLSSRSIAQVRLTICCVLPAKNTLCRRVYDAAASCSRRGGIPDTDKGPGDRGGPEEEGKGRKACAAKSWTIPLTPNIFCQVCIFFSYI